MSSDILLQLIPFAPEIFIIALAIFCLIFGLYNSFSKAIWWVASIGLIFCLLLMSKNDALIVTKPVLGGIVNEEISIWLKSILISFTILILIFYGGLNRVKVYEHGRHEFVIIILIATVGSMFAISARSFLVLYIALEIVSLSSYILASYDRDLNFSAEAGVKYFILGSLSSCLMIFGMSYIYGFSGAFDYASVSFISQENLSIGLASGIFLFCCGLLFKLSIFPFHFWTPDIYQGSPFISVAFFTSIPKFASIAGMYNIIKYVISGFDYLWFNGLVIIAIASMVIGGVGALQQKSFKRMIGYSTILNMGFILLSLSLNSTNGFTAAIIYQVVYSVSTLGLLAALAITTSPSSEDYQISTLSGFGFVKKLAAFSISIFMFSLVGIPPLAGFFAKFYVIEALVNKQMYSIAAIVLLISVVAAFYYINIVKVMYFSTPNEKQLKLHESTAMVFVISICTFIAMFFPFLGYVSS
jgi:NADH-quinone oxidoreductase subunit N